MPRQKLTQKNLKRKIDGQVYDLAGWHQTKAKAQSHAQKLRKIGALARVFPRNYGKYKYQVWVKV